MTALGICANCDVRKVQVFHAKEIDGDTWFMIWSENLKMWGFYKPENFAPYPFWMEDERNGTD